MNKICKKCNNNKPLANFSKNKKTKDKYNIWCKPCINTYNTPYRLNNKDRIKLLNKRYNIENKEYLREYKRKYIKENKQKYDIYFKKYREINALRIKQVEREYYKKNASKYSEYNKKYKRENRELLSKKAKQKLRENPICRLRNNLRTRLRRAITGSYKSGSAVRDLGCSVEELKIYLEKQFQPGMTWENWSKDGWHIDHIKPLSSFNLVNRDELLIACHYTNLQPLWAIDNFKKSNKKGLINEPNKED